MRYLFSVFVFSIVLISCNQQQSIPKNVLPPSKMKAVLWDLLRADEVVNFYMVKDSAFRTLKKRTDLYQTVFTIHNISKAEFKNSLRFYEDHPEILKPIVDSMESRTDSLSKKLFKANFEAK
jgi:hypothetical protein